MRLAFCAGALEKPFCESSRVGLLHLNRLGWPAKPLPTLRELIKEWLEASP